jgi:hypothetical protein
MGDDDNICNDTAYQNMIIQKQRFQLLNIPPSRYDNLANNPYVLTYPGTSQKFTKAQLDMRRKVEVLKYSANNSSTQTNRFTKAEIFAQAVSGKYQQRTYSNVYITENIQNNQLNACPTVKTPTSASGVPGRVIYLYEDNNVPLYNFITNIDGNYGTLTQSDNPYRTTWDYTKDSNKTGTNKENSFTAIITSLFIYYNDVPFKTFTITTPISLEFKGSATSLSSQSMNFTVSNVTTNILYNNIRYIPITPTISNLPTKYEITVNNIYGSPFSGKCYLGVITITNVILPIQKGFIFDIQPAITYTNSPTSNITMETLKVTFNVSSFTRLATNCTISGDVNPITIPSISVTSDTL